jgi:hypothetical protein
MMKKSRILLVLATVVAIAILLVACGGGKTATPAAETQSVGPVTTQETGTTPSGETAATATPPNGVPDDVPIMPNARELQASNMLNVIYKIDVSINDVVAFYQQELPNYGWETVNNPDSVVGSMAQMARAKANGDRITFSIQYNPVGEFCIVQIYLTRVP